MRDLVYDDRIRQWEKMRTLNLKLLNSHQCAVRFRDYYISLKYRISHRCASIFKIIDVYKNLIASIVSQNESSGTKWLSALLNRKNVWRSVVSNIYKNIKSKRIRCSIVLRVHKCICFINKLFIFSALFLLADSKNTLRGWTWRENNLLLWCFCAQHIFFFVWHFSVLSLLFLRSAFVGAATF